MGLLTLGTPLNWTDSKKIADIIRKRGIKQFINIHHKLKDRKNDCLKWGDEVSPKFKLLNLQRYSKRKGRICASWRKRI